MSYMITEECIACNACLPVCPTAAVEESVPVYKIIADACSECVVDFKTPRCLTVCPIDAITKDPANEENHQALLDKRSRILENGALPS